MTRIPLPSPWTAGDFVIAWQGQTDSFPYNGVFAQLYNSSGAPQGSQFQVDSGEGYSNRFEPMAAMDSAGDFVIAFWTRQGADSSYEIYGREYQAGGVALGSEFQVYAGTFNDRNIHPSVSMDSAGDFVVAWTLDGQGGDGSGYGIFVSLHCRGLGPRKRVPGQHLYDLQSGRWHGRGRSLGSLGCRRRLRRRLGQLWRRRRRLRHLRQALRPARRQHHR